MERFCLTQALYYEARGEGVQGQLAVADVVLQRQRSKYHPDTICGVVYEPYQFSFVSDGSTLREIDVEAWNKADDLSGRILRHEVKTSLTGRALFYHTKAVRPDWAEFDGQDGRDRQPHLLPPRAAPLLNASLHVIFLGGANLPQICRVLRCRLVGFSNQESRWTRKK